MRERALELLTAGLSVIPVKSDGSKAPALPTFEEYKSKRRPSKTEIKGWFADGRTLGVAIICGSLSGNLAVLDFESKDVYTSWRELAESEGLDLGDLPVVSTPRGFHVYVRLPKPIPGKKLASQTQEYEDKDKGKRLYRTSVLIEFRGHGQYVVGPGSPAECHPEKKAGWKLSSGPDITETPTITQDMWDGLVRCARAFNEIPDNERKIDGLNRVSVDDQRPGTDFCRRASLGDFQKLLEDHEWELIREDASGRQIWRRPGKDEPGGSATLGVVTTSLGNCLYVFSTNALPFEADGCYTIFAARALLQFGGDFGRTAGQCRVEGYGKPAAAELRDEIAGYIARWNDEVELGRLEDMVKNFCAVSTTFKRTWEAKRTKELGECAHRYTRSILYHGVTRLGTPEESGLCQGVGLVRLWRRDHGRDPASAEDADYMSRQAADVLANAEHNEGEMQERAEAKDAGVTRETRLKWLRERFAGLPIQRFIQYRGNANEGNFWLVLADSSSNGTAPSEMHIEIGDIDATQAFATFERALMGWRSDDGRGVPGFRGGLPESIAAKVVWRAIRRVLWEVTELEGQEDTLAVAIFRWVQDFAEGYGAFMDDPIDGEDDDMDAEQRAETLRNKELNGTPFVEGRFLWITLDSFCSWLKNRKEERFTRRSLIDLLRSSGFVKMDRRPVTDDGRTKQRSFWTCPLKKLPSISGDGVPF